MHHNWVSPDMQNKRHFISTHTEVYGKVNLNNFSSMGGAFKRLIDDPRTFSDFSPQKHGLWKISG